MGLFSAPIATIFAREFLEAAIIIGQYCTVARRNADFSKERTRQALADIWIAAGSACLVAMFVILCVAIPLAVAGNDLDKTAAEVIEGVSKIVAAVCILGLSLKIPKWLHLYGTSKEKELGLTRRDMIFNVAWNIWREMAEVGIFLIPFFLSKEDVDKIPLSALGGVAIGIFLGGLLYVANSLQANKVALALVMSGVTGWLSIGLFTGGMHEFEEVLGETPDVFWFPGCKSSKADSCQFWSHKKFPMALFKPFGYSHSPTKLQMACFWIWTAVLVISHAVKFHIARVSELKAASAKPEPESVDVHV